jgi:PAS domain S-box-containing protein
MAMPDSEAVQIDLLSTVTRYAIDGLSAIIAILDPTGSILVTNRAWNEFAIANSPISQASLGVGANYLMVCDRAMRNGSAEAGTFAAGIRAVIAEEQPTFEMEYPCHSPTEKRWFLGRVTRIMVDGLLYVIVAHENITKRVLSEQGTRLFSTVINESLSGIIITDAIERMIYVNPAFERISGYTLEELRGHRPSILQGEGTDIQTKREIRETLQAQHPISVEILNYHKSGRPYWIEMHIAPVFDVSGELTHFVAIENDISLRKKVEADLRHSEARLEEAQRIARVGSWEFDVVAQQITWSKELFHLLGRKLELGAPNSEESLALYPPEDAAHVYRLAERAIRTGIGYDTDVRRILQDGSTHWFQAIGNTVKDETGNVIRLVGTLLDITQRKQVEQELADLHYSLQQAREAETAISARVQSVLLTPTIPQNLPGVEIAALSLPSQQVDGDFSDFVVHSDKLFDLVIGDVMGKGLTAALLGAATKAQILRSFIYHLLDNAPDARLPSPEALVRRVHHTLTPRLIQLETFITVTFVRFDLAAGCATLVDCGHTHTIHYQATTDEYRLIQGDGLPLGVLEKESYRQISIAISPGDLFVFYSDGITEAHNPEGEMYGANRLLELLRSRRYETPKEQIEALQRSLRDYTDTTNFADDVTCIVVAIHE